MNRILLLRSIKKNFLYLGSLICITILILLFLSSFSMVTISRSDILEWVLYGIKPWYYPLTGYNAFLINLLGLFNCAISFGLFALSINLFFKAEGIK